jgi:hypothetical protein
MEELHANLKQLLDMSVTTAIITSQAERRTRISTRIIHIQEQLRANIIEREPQENCVTDDNELPVHFSPHHAVIRKERETTKVRIVYDGSAKSSKKEQSLNDCLETGTNHIPLHGVHYVGQFSSQSRRTYC